MSTTSAVNEVASQPQLDTDIAFGYQTIDQNIANTDKNIKNVLAQITNKY